jgi:hypothetical protein
MKKRQVYILVEVEQKTQISVVDTVQYSVSDPDLSESGS